MISGRTLTILLIACPLLVGCGAPKEEDSSVEGTDSGAPPSSTTEGEEGESTVDVPSVNDVTVNVSWGKVRDVEAVGTLWIAVYESLPDVPAEALMEEPFVVTSVEIDAAGSAPDTVLASHVFEDLPVTTDLYYLNVFLDVNGNAALPVPVPDSGDVWARGGAYGFPGVSAAAENAEANVLLTFVTP